MEIINMNERIIVKNGDGTVSIMIPALNTSLSIEEIAAKDVPEGLSYRIVDKSIIPTDREFRNAWTDDFPGPQLDVDMNKARDIWMDKIRVQRNKKLKELDTSFMLALESGDTVAQGNIAAEKQVLRDIPQTFDLTIAVSPAALKALWPAELV